MTTVVHLTPATFGRGGTFGGGERYPTELALAMSDVVPTKIVGFGPERFSQRLGNLTIETLPTRLRWKGSEMNPMSEAMLRVIGRPSVVHLHQWESTTMNAALLYGRLVGARVFATDHGGSGRNYWRRFRLHKILTGFLPVSEFSRSFYPELSDKATVIHGGADPDRFRPTDTPRTHDVTFVGRLMPHKGVAELLRCLPDDVSVQVVGRPYDSQYRADLHRISAGKRVTFNESADDAAVIEAYRSSKVVVLPSQDPRATAAGRRPKTELLGLTLLEAMACGTPVVCTDVGGMPEVVRDGVTGRVARLAEPDGLRHAVLDVIEADDHRWQEMSRAARRHVEDSFTWRRVAESCLQAYGLKPSARPATNAGESVGSKAGRL